MRRMVLVTASALSLGATFVLGPTSVSGSISVDAGQELTSIGDDEETLQTPQEALQMDLKTAAESISRTFDMPVSQAAEQMRVQDALHAVTSKEDPGLFSAHVVYGNNLKIVYQTTTPGLRDVVNEQISSFIRVPFILEYQVVPLDLADLQDASDRVLRQAPELRDLTYSSEFDVSSGTIVYTSNREIGSELGDQIDLAAQPALVRWKTGETKAPYVGGGGVLMSIGCTGGFVVQQQGSSNTALSGADHCRDRALYTSYSTWGTVQGQSMQPTSQDPVADLGWWDNSAISWSASFYFGQSSNRAVTSRKNYTDMRVSDYVCKYGYVGGYQCGTITSLTLAPFAGAQNVWVDTTAYGCPGDSGGPVWQVEQAWGILGGGPQSGCGGIYFTPQNRLGPSLGVTVLTQ